MTTTTFDGRVAIITGASRGIGAGTAVAFADAGASVVLAARDRESLERIAAGINAGGGRALAVTTDVSEAGAVEELVDRTVREFGRLDVLFNNAAGGGHRPTLLADVDPADFDSALGVSLRGVFLGMKFAIPRMLDGGGGAIVNMASTAGVQAVSGLAGYVAAKHGVIGITRVAALDYASRNIRVNVVAPGPILTDQLEQAGQEMQDRAAASMPMQRVGAVQEVAEAVLWLASDAASYITGTVLPVDGGKLAGVPTFAQMAPAGSR
jgi:NAD(P)-dependent dehydrogenase (short-subunit alcohol dehydrogenase family)